MPKVFCIPAKDVTFDKLAKEDATDCPVLGKRITLAPESNCVGFAMVPVDVVLVVVVFGVAVVTTGGLTSYF